MRRIFRTVVAVLGVALLIAVGLLAADEFWKDVLGLTDCNTTLCCEACQNIPVTRVIDGDTFVSGPFRVRLFGVDTPEVGQRCASEATARLRALAGNNVRVELRPRTEDRFGRRLYRELPVDVEQRAREQGVGCSC